MNVIHHVRGFGDVEIPTSYFLLLWSEWVFRGDSSTLQTQIFFREDFGGTGLEHNRQELIERLDRILEELNREAERFRKHRPLLIGNHAYFARNEYKSLRETLLEVEKEAMNTPACASQKSNLPAVVLITVGMYRTPLFPYAYSAPPHPPFILVRSTIPLGLLAGFHFVDSGCLVLPI